jgi:hypothetical protein
MRVHGVRSAAAVAMFAVVMVVDTGPALAGGSWLHPVQDRYELGEMATLVGYTGGPQLAAHRAPGPYRAFLQDEAGAVRIEVGTLELTDRGTRGWESLRVAVRFLIPTDIAPGPYSVTYCTGLCDRPAQLGDFVEGYLFVGMEPRFRPSRGWPMDEPEIANLADDALLSGPGYQTTAGEVRTGVAPRRSAQSPGSPGATSAPAVTAPVVTALPAPPTAPYASPWERVLWLGAASAVLAGLGLCVRRRPQGPGPDTGDEGPGDDAIPEVQLERVPG